MSKNDVNGSTEEFLEELRNVLSNNQIEQALYLIDNDDHDYIIQQCSWEIVPAVCSYLTVKNEKHNKKFLECCISILEKIAHKCNPSETILEFLEQAEYEENDENDVKFRSILKPLAVSLNKIDNKEKTIEWCISSVRSYVQNLPLPENEKPEVIEEDVSLRKSTVVLRLINIQKAILQFLEPLVENVTLTETDVNESMIVRYHLSSLLIYLLGKPFCYLSEHCDKLNNLTEIMVSFVFQIYADPLSFLPIIRERLRKHSHKRKASNDDESRRNLCAILFESTESIPTLSYANFYFYIITKESFWSEVPHVYNLFYILEMCMHLSYCLIEEQKYVLIEKGLDLMRAALKRVGKRAMKSKMITSKIYMKMFQMIANVMIYNDSQKIRKNALSTYEEYLEIFDMQARYSVISQLYKTTEHSGLLSLIIGKLKWSIIECLSMDPPCPYFIGENLTSLLGQIYTLPNNSATDLVEISDEVISALNLLRFLFLRDRHNETGIWDVVGELQTEYLKPLREAIDLCKVHWGVKLMDLKEHEKMLNKLGKSVHGIEKEITLIVGGEKVPSMPINEKIKFCHQVINGLDVMESVLARVNECIADNPLK